MNVRGGTRQATRVLSDHGGHEPAPTRTVYVVDPKREPAISMKQLVALPLVKVWQCVMGSSLNSVVSDAQFGPVLMVFEG